MHHTLYCTAEAYLGFHVSMAWWGVEFARGILRHLCGRLKETDHIKHKKNNFLLNLKVYRKSKPRRESIMCFEFATGQ